MRSGLVEHGNGTSVDAATSRFSKRVASLTGEDAVSASDDVRRRLFAIVFAGLTIPVVIVFALSDWVQGNTLDAVAEGAFAVLLVFLTWLLVTLRRPTVVYYIVLSALLVLFTYLVWSPEEGAARLYWLFVFVPVATFTIGRWGGTLLGALLLATVLVLVSPIASGGPDLHDVDLIRFVVTFVILGVLVHVAEYARERTHATLGKEHRALLEAHERIRELSVTDSLTGVYNRQFLAERLSGELERASRYDRPLSLILCDIDHFKRLNDTHGHLIGDAFLRQVAMTLRNSVRREVDWVVRYGGEEFVILLPETDQSDAEQVAERLRSRINEVSLATEAGEIGCTASFGVASRTPATKMEEELLEAADKALYRAKAQGRDCVASGRYE